LLIGDNINQKSFNMMKFLRLLICVCILLIADQTVYSAQEKWIFINQDQGVTMHSRKVAGRAESEFRGSSTIDQPVEVVGAVLAAIPSFTRWFYKCIQARKIPDKTSTDLNFLIYIVIETPWPLWNRDVVYATATTIDIASGNIKIQGHARQDAAVPIRKDHVRITDSELQWTLERLDSNQTMVTFTKRINAGGNLGSYLSDAGCKKTVFSSLVNMRDVAADPKYAALGEKLRQKYGNND
jgi:hypothetical protein